MKQGMAHSQGNIQSNAKETSPFLCQDILKSLCAYEDFTDTLKSLILSQVPEVSIQGLELAANLFGESFYELCIQELSQYKTIRGLDIHFCLWLIEAIHCSALDDQSQEQLLSCFDSLAFESSLKPCDLSLVSALPKLHTLSLYNMPKAHCSRAYQFSNLVNFQFDMLEYPNDYFTQWFDQLPLMTQVEKLSVKHPVRQMSLNLTHLQNLRTLEIFVPAGHETLDLSIEHCPHLNQANINHCHVLKISHCSELTELAFKLEAHNATAKILDCPKLTSLSAENIKYSQCTIQNSPAIQELNLTGCRLAHFHLEPLLHLQKLSLIDSYFDLDDEDLGFLSTVKELNIKKSHLFNIPFEFFTQLNTLNLRNSHVVDLDLSTNTSLELVNLRDLPKLETLKLPPLIKSLSMSYLKVHQLTDLEALSQLESLKLSKLAYLQTANITTQSLKHLIIEDCPSLNTLSFPSENLQELRLNRLGKLTAKSKHKTVKNMHTQSAISSLDAQQDLILDIVPNTLLKDLNISDCHLLKGINGLTNATQLTELCITGTEIPINLDDLSDLQLLETVHLNLKWSPEQRYVHCETFIQMSSLRSLKLYSFKNLKSINNLPKLKHLEELTLTHCSKLYDLDVLSELSALKHLQLSHCQNLNSLNLRSKQNQLLTCQIQHSNLNSLSIKNVTNLSALELNQSVIKHLELKALSNLIALKLPLLHMVERLSLNRINSYNFKQVFKHLELKSDKLTTLHLESLNNLKSLKVDASKLTSITLSHLPHLKTLHLSCPVLTTLSLTNVYKLNTLTILDAFELNTVLDWQKLSHLGALELSGYKHLSKLEELSPLYDLRHLNIKKIEGIDDLNQIHQFFPMLESLSLSAFVQYKSVIELRNLSQLKSLYPCRLWRAVGLRKGYNNTKKRKAKSHHAG